MNNNLDLDIDKYSDYDILNLFNCSQKSSEKEILLASFWSKKNKLLLRFSRQKSFISSKKNLDSSDIINENYLFYSCFQQN